jgi:hypothetical protein
MQDGRIGKRAELSKKKKLKFLKLMFCAENPEKI